MPSPVSPVSHVTPRYDALKAKQRRKMSVFDNDVWLRIYRSLSWLQRAEVEPWDDLDAKFIYYWIAFNAAYGREREFGGDETERDALMDFFRKAALVDRRNKLGQYVFTLIPRIMESLVANKFVFRDFWEHYNGRGHSNWRTRLNESVDRVRIDIHRRDSVRVLTTVFERLYVLRNQLIHGGATWNSRVNREQVELAANIMGYTIPVFIDLMMDRPDFFNGGRPYYPVVGDPLGINP